MKQNNEKIENNSNNIHNPTNIWIYNNIDTCIAIHVQQYIQYMYKEYHIMKASSQTVII